MPAAAADSELSSDPPQKRYMGVRVKMPVRELLRKIRLSKGLDPAPGKEASAVKMAARGSSGKTAEKRRSHPYTEKQLRQSKQSAGQSPRGLEDLDILVEVLQEDLNQSQLGEERRQPVPDGFWQGFTRELQSCCWQGRAAAQGGPAELHPQPWGREFHPVLRGQAQPSLHGQQESTQRSCSHGMFSRTGEDGGSWWVQDGPLGSQEGFMRDSPSQGCLLRDSPSQGCLLRNSSTISLGCFNPSFRGFFYPSFPFCSFPTEFSSRLLHKAVAQGRRALTFALAQRFASLNKIDEKDAEKRTALHLAAEKNQHLMVSDLISLGANVNEQDSSGKTPLHLCAQNGYLRVLQVLKSCKNNGVCVEVDLPDHHAQFKWNLTVVVSPPVQSCGLLDAPGAIPAPPGAENSPGLGSLSSSELLDVLLEGKC
nr:uncharacterized protein LOC113460209 [Zonotrichia albicollis]